MKRAPRSSYFSERVILRATVNGGEELGDAMKGRVGWAVLFGVVLGAAAMAAAPPVALADGACGSKENPCPMQARMRQRMALANSKGDMDGLVAEFTKIAAMAPDKGWNGP